MKDLSLHLATLNKTLKIAFQFYRCFRSQHIKPVCSFDLSLRLLYDPRASLLRREYAMLRDIWYTEPICQNVFGEWYLKYLLQSKDWNQIKQSWFRKKHWIGTNGNILEQIYLIRENVTKTQNYKFNVCNISFK